VFEIEIPFTPEEESIVRAYAAAHGQTVEQLVKETLLAAIAQEQSRDPYLDPSTGTKLTPSPQGRECLGNGSWPGYECCCDECDYYLVCFPDWREDMTDREAIERVYDMLHPEK
jgi:plasmid stability protein